MMILRNHVQCDNKTLRRKKTGIQVFQGRFTGLQFLLFSYTIGSFLHSKSHYICMDLCGCSAEFITSQLITEGAELYLIADDRYIRYSAHCTPFVRWFGIWSVCWCVKFVRCTVANYMLHVTHTHKHTLADACLRTKREKENELRLACTIGVRFRLFLWVFWRWRSTWSWCFCASVSII